MPESSPCPSPPSHLAIPTTARKSKESRRAAPLSRPALQYVELPAFPAAASAGPTGRPSRLQPVARLGPPTRRPYFLPAQFRVRLRIARPASVSRIAETR